MVIVEIIGGLGNQMFQYATAKALALHKKTELKLNISSFNSYKVHKYSLHHFNINTEIAENNIVIDPTIKQKIKAALFQKKIFKCYKEKNLEYDDNLFNKIDDNIYLKGYFQTEKYFTNFEDEIRKDFEIISPLKIETKKMLEIIKSVNSVSLHIRRGDYISNPNANAFHGICDINYYLRAISLIKEKINNPIFFVFSDDINWAKENLIIENTIHFIDFNDDSTNYEDLKLMSTCKYNIIANSTFSWWGAWLNEFSEKIVIAPKQWFKTDIHSSKDLIPLSWVQL